MWTTGKHSLKQRKADVLAVLIKLCRLWLTNVCGYAQTLMNKDSSSSIRDLYPHLTDKELAEAEDNLERYLALALRIFERTQAECSPQVGQLTSEPGTLPCTPPRSEP